MRCPRCGASVGAGGLYCSQCGAALVGEPRAASDPARTADERRQVTVLFYDLVGSTRLAQSSDPEDFSEALAVFHQRVETEMSALGGVLGARLGDGAIVYFGYPDAYEDAAERAVLASLHAVAAAAEVVLPGGGRAIARVGVATGPVVIRRVAAGRGNEVVGATANLAARLQAAAPPGAVVIAQTTRQIVGDLFRLEDLGPVTAKGYADGVRAWKVVGRGDVDRFRALRAGAQAPLVGRGAELQQLVSAWRRTAAGRAGVALIAGDPGVGKSRLAAALVAQPELADAAVLRFFCTAHTQNAPLRPFADQLRRVSGLEPDDPPAERRRKLVAFLSPDTTAEDLAMLGALVGLPIAPGSALAGLEPAQRLDRTLGALSRQVQLLARRRPVVILFEDAQWGDPTSLGLMEAFQRGAIAGPILLVVTARPEFRPGWTTAARVTSVSLAPLLPEESDVLLTRIAGGKGLPAAVRRLILHRADGVPLFLEEITRAVVEARQAEAAPGAEMDVPTSLQDSLLARLDRLQHGKALAQVGAVIGRDFSQELLAELTGQDAASLRTGLEQLTQAGLVVAGGGAQRPVYQFRHVLIQESASGTLLKAERRRLNRRLVEVLEQRFPDVARAEPERLARHAAEAGMTATAVGYWLKAGLQALGQSGMSEAISRLKAGLALTQTLPADEPRWRLELDLEIALGKAQIATIGYAPAATGETFARAQALCAALGQPAQWLTVLHGEWTHDLLRGRLGAARARADELLALGEARGDALHTLMGCRLQGVTAFPTGEFEKARANLERGLELFDPARRTAYAQITLDDGRVVMLTYLAWVLSYLGATEAALRRAEEALAEAQSLAQPYSTAHAMNGLAFTLLLDGRYAAAAARLEELAALTAEHGMSYYAAICQALQGRCRVGQGDAQEGARVLRRAIRAYRATDSVLYLPTFMTWLAQALGREGRIGEGLRMTASAQALIRKTGMRFDQAATYEAEAELHLLAEHPEAAAVRLEKALATAAEQRAPLVARRARMALDRLRANHPTVAREALQAP